MKACVSLLLVLSILTTHTAAVAEPPSPIIDYDSRFHPVIGTNGIVSTQEARASEIGLQVLKDGGNAVDSAIAVAYALAVTLPKAGNLGGGGFMLVHSAEDGQTYAFDFREMAPQAATRDMYLDDNGDVDQKRARGSARRVSVFRERSGAFRLHMKNSVVTHSGNSFSLRSFWPVMV